MPSGPLTISLELSTRRLCAERRQLRVAFRRLPKRFADPLRRKSKRLLRIDNIPNQRRVSARFAGHLRVEIRIGRMQELLAAARRAAKSHGAQIDHGGPRGK